MKLVLKRGKACPRDLALRMFCADIGYHSIGNPDVCTYYHNNGANSTSRIDHMMSLGADNWVNDIQVLSREYKNLSSHDPVSGRLTLKLWKQERSCDGNSSRCTAKARVRWDKVD